jgi:hypothetical protein
LVDFTAWHLILKKKEVAKISKTAEDEFINNFEYEEHIRI